MSYSYHPFKNKKCLPKLPNASLGKQGNLIEYMKLLPRYIIFWAITNYIDEVKQEEIMKEFVTYKKIGDALFMRVINKHFNIEVFRKNPIIWQDIWLYNYITYDFKKGKFPKNNLIERYEKEIIIPVDGEIMKLFR